MRRKRPWLTPSRLGEAVSCARGLRGLNAARAAILLIRPGTDSNMETRARLILVAAGLPCPQVNVAALDEADRSLALPDMSFPEVRLAIEYDGDLHRTDRPVWMRDIARRQRLEEAGWRIITVTAEDIREPSRFIARVCRALVDRGGNL